MICSWAHTPLNKLKTWIFMFNIFFCYLGVFIVSALLLSNSRVKEFYIGSISLYTLVETWQNIEAAVVNNNIFEAAVVNN